MQMVFEVPNFGIMAIKIENRIITMSNKHTDFRFLSLAENEKLISHGKQVGIIAMIEEMTKGMNEEQMKEYIEKEIRGIGGRRVGVKVG